MPLRTGHAAHFGDSLAWVGNEADHQCHGSGIEFAVSKWQRLRVAATELRKAHSRSGASISDLCLGWIESLHLRGRTMCHDQFGESAVSAADI